jgi:hypothetical protein
MMALVVAGVDARVSAKGTTMRLVLLPAFLCGVLGLAACAAASAEPADQRTPVALTASETAWLFGEMRENLVAIQAIASALSDNDLGQVHRIAADLGVGPWTRNPSRPPNLIAKFPPPWKVLAAQVHQDFDSIAEAAAGKESNQQMLARISKLIRNCTACHASYRVVEAPQ